MNNYTEQEHLSYPNKLYREKFFELKTKTVKPRITDYRQPEPGGNAAIENSLKNSAFNETNSEIFSKFLPHLENFTFAAQETIYQPGEKIDYVYFPQSSIFSEFQILENGGSIEIAMTGSEGIIGLASIFDDNPINNWTQTSVAGSALRLKSQILREEADYNRELQQIIYGCVGSYIKQISQRSVCNNYHSLEKRLCGWLLMMQNRFKDTILPLTQEQMARILGVNRPSISYIAYSLRIAEIIDYRRGSLVILNREKLKNHACYCFAEIDKNFENIF